MRRRELLKGSAALTARGLVPGSALLLAGCGKEPVTLTRVSGPTMGTAFEIAIGTPGIDAEVVRAAAVEALERTEALMSTYRADSELSHFNRGADTDWVRISPETAQVVGAALSVAERSDGAFDPTVAPLVDLWGFGPGHAADSPPAERHLSHALDHVGRHHLELHGERGALRKHKALLSADLSGVAKGWGLDEVARRLDTMGVDSYLIDVGGELRTRGRKPDGTPWRIGVERPVPGPRAVHRVVHADDLAIATSGDYRNFFAHDGRHYSHTIDPRTGRSVEHALASVSVLHQSAMMADAWSTALMVAGPERGYELAKREGIAALFLARTATGVADQATPAFAPHIVS